MHYQVKNAMLCPIPGSMAEPVLFIAGDIWWPLREFDVSVPDTGAIWWVFRALGVTPGGCMPIVMVACPGSPIPSDAWGNMPPLGGEWAPGKPRDTRAPLAACGTPSPPLLAWGTPGMRLFDCEMPVLSPTLLACETFGGPRRSCKIRRMLQAADDSARTFSSSASRHLSRLYLVRRFWNHTFT